MEEAELAALARRLRQLPLRVSEISVQRNDVAIPSYGEELRPTSTVELAGLGACGRGEYVGWTPAEHQAFGNHLRRVPRGETTIARFALEIEECFAEPYARAALEAAAIDLGLRQANQSMATLCGHSFETVRYVRSFSPLADPEADLPRLRVEAPGIEFKLDVNLWWSHDALAAVAAAEDIAILDFKKKGSTVQALQIHHRIPGPLLEDPAGNASLPEAMRARLSLDAEIAGSHPLRPIERHSPVAVNLKVPRIGSVLRLLDIAAFCAARGIGTYLGGMFEVDVGRRQALALAALLCPSAPNDIAPIPGTGSISFPERLVPAADAPGFGAEN
jgi:L-alanine-DL-glutamate epimerase-like enolase superfamily enzyme